MNPSHNSLSGLLLGLGMVLFFSAIGWLGAAAAGWTDKLYRAWILRTPRTSRIMRWILWIAVAAVVMSRFELRTSGNYPGVTFRLAGFTAGYYRDYGWNNRGTIGGGDPRAGVEGPEWRHERLVIYMGELDWIHRGIAPPAGAQAQSLDGEGGSVE